MFGKQKSPLLNEEEADKEVIRSLMREVNKIIGESNMSHLLKNAAGELLAVHRFEKVTVEDAKELLTRLEADAELLRQFIAEALVPATPATPAAPVAPVAPEVPAEPIAPASLPADQPAPPVDQPAATDVPPADIPAAADPTEQLNLQ